MHTAQRRAESLRQSGCQRRGTDAPAENTHKQQIQHHIHRGGDDQIVQRVAAVPQRVKDAHEDVVHDGEQRTEEIVPEIGHGLGEHILRGAHPPQDGGGENDTQNGKRQTGTEPHGDVGMDGLDDGVVIPGTVTPGDDHAGAHCHAVEEADHHEDEVAGGTDRSQGGITQETAYHPGVKGVIKLLEDVSQKNREGEEQHSFPNRALGERALLLDHGARAS